MTKDSLGNVHLAFNATRAVQPTGYSLLFTLPQFARPRVQLFIPCINNSGSFAFIRIDGSGQLFGFMPITGQGTFHANISYNVN